MDEEAKGNVARTVKDVHKALGMWSIRRALSVAFSGAAVLMVAAWYLVSWMLGSPPKAKAKPLDASAQLDLLKLVFALVAGIGALVALVTAYRRQRIEEVAGERAERIQAHAEQVARDNAHDATERRVTDLYGKAVEQLGHDKAAVRLGGLYALERLAQDHLQHRQTIIDVVCAYLRMPFQYTAPSSPTPQPREPGPGPPSETQEGDPRQELQVRLTAQRLLARHLKIRPPSTKDPSPTYPDSYWDEIDLDLTDAHLINLDLSDCRPHHADFSRAQFSGYASFNGAQFSGYARFNGARFSGYARFHRARFSGYARFHRAQFSSDAGFDDAQFSEDAEFNGARFSWSARFDSARFGWDALFDRVQVIGGAFFRGAQFAGDVGFISAKFFGIAEFGAATFGGSVEFVGAVAAAASPPDDKHGWPPGWRTDSSSPDQDMAPLVREQ